MKKDPVICAIVACSENRVIGREGNLPWHIPDDLKRFKKITTGKPVIMGRKTFESIGKPLPGRANIVISRSGINAAGTFAFASLADAIAEAKKISAAANQEEIFIIGGGQIYEQALPLTERIYMTIVHQTIEGDAYFPALKDGEWTKTQREDHTGYSFITMERKHG